MSAVANNLVYKVYVDKSMKPMPVMSKEKIEACKSAVAKYLRKK